MSSIDVYKTSTMRRGGAAARPWPLTLGFRGWRSSGEGQRVKVRGLSVVRGLSIARGFSLVRGLSIKLHSLVATHTQTPPTHTPYLWFVYELAGAPRRASGGWWAFGLRSELLWVCAINKAINQSINQSELNQSINQPIKNHGSQNQDGRHFGFFMTAHFFQFIIYKCDTCFIPFFGVENLILVFK